jgi:flagellin
MRELAVQSASDGVNGDDRSSIDLEFQQLKAEITRISDATEYNNTKLLNGNIKSKLTSDHADHTIDDVGTADVTVDSAQAGTYTITVDSSNNNVTLSSTDGRSQTIAANDITTTNGTLTHAKGEVLDFTSLGVKVGTSNDVTISQLGGKKLVVDAGADIQVGANNVALEDRIAFGISDHRANQPEGLNLTSTDLTSLGKAQSAINELDTAIDKVNDSRGNIGALQNRFEFTSSNLMNSIQNNSASMSTIRDADFAVEAADLARNQILTQSGSAMLAQANSLSQNVLSLLR